VSDTRYLWQRGTSWYVRVRVPPKLCGLVGDTHIRRSLRTKNLSTAQRLRWRVVGEIKAHLERLRLGEPTKEAPSHPGGDPRGWAAEIHKLREEGDHEAADNLELVATDFADRVEEVHGRDAGARWMAAALTKTTLDELLKDWLGAAPYKEGTKATYRLAYGELRALVGLQDGQHMLVGDVTSPLVAKYAFEYLPSKGYSAKAMTTRLGGLSSLWTWLQHRLIVPVGPNPFTGLRVSRLAPKVSRTHEKRGFTDDELIALLQGTDRTRAWDTYGYIRDLMLLGLYSGARLNELASLTVQDVAINGDHAIITIREGKTEAASRELAVTHWGVLGLLQRRTADKQPEGQLFHELKPSGTDDKPGVQASKAFTRYRRACGVQDGTDFHSLRRVFLTAHERHGTDYVAVARFVGHQIGTVMHQVYSAGASREALVRVAEATRYSPEVEAAVARLVSL